MYFRNIRRNERKSKGKIDTACPLQAGMPDTNSSDHFCEISDHISENLREQK